MLSSVVNQCLSLALTSASRQMSLVGSRATGRARWQAPLAAYPRLIAVMAQADREGMISSRRRLSAY
ncbi:hypothetical protein P7D22_02600 [Lichenihabitans sp. Uapishka_5]|uniref:hypothetical protein n=1 Tax=Lichenihabitans sp. Uapishka_5 TaxID=3037302 RepID=UPI0029E81F57|nr:hypothetical protein [Lichenihabitans sp. Uapishka_5]MDX7950065.1 hypothetical protein [Lichenihabitans sp. Uapishka_5]